ncbi:hypothetical protein [Paracoccus thiocyanatus]|nr:hypothetical protein [Paracoccus thiocyanatus]
MSDHAGGDYISGAISRLSTYLAALIAAMVVLFRDYSINFSAKAESDVAALRIFAEFGYPFLLFLVGFATFMVSFALVLAFNADHASGSLDQQAALVSRRHGEKKIKSLFAVGANLVFFVMVVGAAVFLLLVPGLFRIETVWINLFIWFFICVALLVFEVVTDGVIEGLLRRAQAFVKRLPETLRRRQ